MYYYNYFIVFVVHCVTFGKTEYVFHKKAQGFLKLQQPATWRAAIVTCFLEDAVLASPENEHIFEAMSVTLQKESRTTTHVFTGVHNKYYNDHFFTLQGTPLKRLPVPMAYDLNQGSDEKQAPTTDSCLTMHFNGILNNNNCSDVLPYFCFKSSPSCGIEEDGYNYESRTKKCYKFHSEIRSWNDGFDICTKEGGHLTIINGDSEAAVIKDLFANAKNINGYSEEVVFIGFTELGTHDGRLWMTIHGQSLEKAGYNKWHPGQPASKDSRCGAIYGDGLLDDFYCKIPRGFICEKAPIDIPAGEEGTVTDIVL